MKNTNTASCFKYVFAFFAAFWLFCAVVCFVAELTATPAYTKMLIRKSDFTKLSVSDIKDNLSEIAIPGGLPEDFFEYGITKKTLDDNIYKFVDASYKNKAYAEDSSVFKKEITDRIYGYAEKKIPGYTEETRKGIDELIDTCVRRYMVHTKPTLIRYIGNYCGRLRMPAILAMGAAAFLTALSIIMLIWMKADRKYYNISAISASLMIGVFPLVFLVFKNPNRLGIAENSSRAFVSAFIKTPLYIMLAAVVIIAVITVAVNLILRAKFHRE